MPFSRLLAVRQNFPDRRLADPAGEVRKQLAAANLAARVKPGGRVAIGVGSRGIANIAAMAREVVEYWKAAGAAPFIFPAMGSHGAATAEGQADVLARYGITAAAMGCPLVSRLDVVSLGKTAGGIEAFMDRAAWESDGVLLVNRVKWHTDFEGAIESGLFKMMAIGLGKFAGAQKYHTHGYKLGLEHVVRSVGRRVLNSGKMLGGVAILEDACHNTAKIEVMPAESMEEREEAALALVKSWMGRIPCDLDVLILDEIGKTISGTGMDTKVINRGIDCRYNPYPYLNKIERVFCRGLNELSYGNGVGLGMADVVTDRLVDAIDWTPTRINSLTASTPPAIRIPIHFATDRECLERIAPTVGRFDLGEVTFGWIRNTLELAHLALTENLRPRIEADPSLEIIGGPVEFPFDAEGNLVSPVAPA